METAAFIAPGRTWKTRGEFALGWHKGNVRGLAVGGFDPYQAWLDIPIGDRPVSHYRLLGLPEGEDDPERIAAAADRVVAHLRQFSGTEHAWECQRLLGEAAAAKRCLLDPEQRRRYDAELRGRTGGETPIRPAPPLAGSSSTATPPLAEGDVKPVPPVPGTSSPARSPSGETLLGPAPAVPGSGPIPGTSETGQQTGAPVIRPAPPVPGGGFAQGTVGAAPQSGASPLSPAPSGPPPPSPPAVPTTGPYYGGGPPPGAPPPVAPPMTPPITPPPPAPPGAGPLPVGEAVPPAGEQDEERGAWIPPNRTGRVGKSVAAVIQGKPPARAQKTARARTLRRSTSRRSFYQVVAVVVAAAILLFGVALILVAFQAL